jgi:hypothetical protein
MRNTPPNGRFSEPNAIHTNRSETEALSPALRDLADLLAEIVARRMQTGPVKLLHEMETLGDP